jgi:hypothetical protein
MQLVQVMEAIRGEYFEAHRLENMLPPTEQVMKLREISDAALLAEVKRRGWAVVVPDHRYTNIQDFNNYLMSSYRKTISGIKYRKFVDILLKNMGKEVSREHLVEEIWGGKEKTAYNGIATYTKQLRRQLEGTEFEVQTISGAGLVIQVRE